MKRTNKSTKRFKSWAAVLTLAASLVIMGLFTACPNAAKGGNSGEIVFSYTQVAYDDLAGYLLSASSDKINYIEITGTILVGDFKGENISGNDEAGELGKKIKSHPDKKIALKLPAEARKSSFA